MPRSGAEPTKELVLAAMETRLKTINATSNPDFFFTPEHVTRVEMPELQYLERTSFPEDSTMVYFIADEEGLLEEDATEDEMSEETEIWVAVYRRVPNDKQVLNPFSDSDDYFLKSKERNHIWNDFLLAMAVPNANLGLGFVENVNVTDNRPLWADVPDSLELWVGILFRVSVTFSFNQAEPWAT